VDFAMSQPVADRRPYAVSKAGRLADIFVSLIALTAVSPLILIIAGAIAASGQRPIFRQWRIGHLGAAFEILKFRTVWDDNARLLAGSDAVRRRAAFRRLAGWLRDCGLDELPQLVNVLRGEMRIIGPRPLTEEDFFALPPERELRAQVPPGLTGLAQVCGGQHLSPEQKLELDLAFLTDPRASLWLLIVTRSAARLFIGTSATREGLPSGWARTRKHGQVVQGFFEAGEGELVEKRVQLVPGAVNADAGLQTAAQR
jgi:lipopolysaccharide/colanic/teichoic acid biosynthesis glycosyltransferase